MTGDLPPGASLRGWLDHLQRTGALAHPGIALRHGVAGIAQRLDGTSATLFPHPDGHPVPVVSGLLGGRSWITEDLGVESAGLLTRFESATREPVPWKEMETPAPCQQAVHAGEDVDRTARLPIRTQIDLDAVTVPAAVGWANARSGAAEPDVQSGGRGRKGRSTSGPFCRTSAVETGTSCHRPGRSVSGWETTARESSEKCFQRSSSG